MSCFVHLHVHSDYSLLDGAAKVEALVARAAELEMPALALTDHGVLIGAPRFYRACRAQGIQPVLGMEAYFTPGSRFERRPPNQGGPPTYHLTLLARNEQGYRNLMRLSSIGYLEGFYYKPRIDLEALSRYADGLIALSGCPSGEIPRLLMQGDLAGAEAVARRNLELFGRDHFFLEVMRIGHEAEEKVLGGLRELSRRTGIPLVATGDVHYLHPADAEAQEVLVCIHMQKTLNDRTRLQLRQYPLHMRPPAEMRELFRDLPEAVENTLRVAEACHVELTFGETHLPRFEPPEGKTPEAFLRQLVAQGLRERYGEPVPRAAAERAEHELRIIERMGFAGYFLVVWDFVRFARREGIPVGPGRGSAAGSIVAYALGITALDPLRYELIFERFLNPSRISLPDIDIDFCTEGRDRVIQYVREKYGADRVASILTVGTLQARNVIRDVGRVLEVPLAEVDAIAKRIPAAAGVKLRDVVAKDPELRALQAERPVLKRLFDIACRLEGLARQAGTHAAGIVIADAPLFDLVPLYKRGDEISTQYTMEELEASGLLKMDFLGLKTLTLIHHTVEEVKRHRGVELKLEDLPLDDPATYRLLARGDTGGVFQVESEGMRDLLVRLVPDRFDDLVAALALYRPGPMQAGMLDAFVNRKHGREKVTYLHPALRAILEETYGVILYQEQVMRIAHVLAGFDMAEADSLRKAMGKKQPEVMARYRDRFLERGRQRGHDPQVLAAIFEQIQHFAGYGFNKSHSAAYALLTYQTAYLKANFPVEFTAALLSQEMGNTEKLFTHKREAEARGIRILPPDIQRSHWRFSVEPEGIRFGLGAVKGVGEGAAQELLRARERRGGFRSLFDLVEDVDLRVVNRGVLEALIRCGALDSLGPRGSLLATLDEALAYGARRAREARVGQAGLFEREAAALPPPPLREAPELSTAERLRGEKQTLGFYLSGHPLEDQAELIAQVATARVADLERLRDGSRVILGGIFTAIQRRVHRRGPHAGRKMALAVFEDLTGRVPAMLFAEVYEQSARILAEDRPFFVAALVDRRGETPRLTVQRVVPLEEGRRVFPPPVVQLEMEPARLRPEVLEALRAELLKHPGPAEVQFLVPTGPGTPPRRIQAGERYRVRASADLLHELERLLGVGRVRLR